LSGVADGLGFAEGGEAKGGSAIDPGGRSGLGGRLDGMFDAFAPV
jgi:hypothetical protein